MPAKRVERYDWSTSLCVLVTLPDDEGMRSSFASYRARLDAIREWLTDPKGDASGVYQRQVIYPTASQEEAFVGRDTYRFSDPQTARAFANRFVKPNRC